MESTSIAGTMPRTHQLQSKHVDECRRSLLDHSAPTAMARSLQGVTQVHRMLGKGTLSYVFECSIAGFAQRVAVKMWAQASTLHESREVAILSSFEHPNLVKMHHTIESPCTAFVLELCAGGNLQHFLHAPEHREQLADIGLRPRICGGIDIARGMYYLHSKQFVHRDVRPENCLLAKSNSLDMRSISPLKLGDFGLSRTVETSGHMSSSVGPCWYMAPEVMTEDSDYGFPVDVYSYGMLLCELCTGISPGSWKGGNVASFTLAIVSNLRPASIEELPREGACGDLRELIEECWDGEPMVRPPSEQLVGRLCAMLL
mmetsp:Transcript_33321/g.72047  ORF Transcript_33321/g.72047 Transcript_33321/m.72047 type:complete len:316 (+) Transcript_33321:287-1234(+)